MGFIKRKTEPFKEIQSCLQKRDYKGAAAWFTQLLEKDRKNTKIRLRYADTLVLAGSKKEAVKQYRKVADELAEAGFMIRAIAVSKKIIKLDPSQADLHQKLAAMNQEQSGGALPLQAPGPLHDMTSPVEEHPTIDMEPIDSDEIGMEVISAPPTMPDPPAAPEPTPVREPTLSLEESMAMEFGDTGTVPVAEPPAPIPEPTPPAEEMVELDLGAVGAIAEASADEELAFEEADVTADASYPTTEFDLVEPGEPSAEPTSPDLELTDEEPVFSEAPVSVSADAPAEVPEEEVELEVVEAETLEVELETAEEPAEEDVSLELDVEDVEIEPDMAADGGNPLVGLLGDDIDSMIDSIIDDVGSSAVEEPAPPARQATRIPLFSDLNPNEFVEVAIMLVRRQEKAGTVIVQEGAPGDSMFIVSTGEVVASRNKGGQLIKLAELSDGDFFGEMAVLSGETRTATVTAIKNTELLELTRSDLHKICSRHPEVEAKLRLAYEERRTNS